MLVKWKVYCGLLLTLVLVQCGSRSSKVETQSVPETADSRPSDEKSFQLTRTDQNEQVTEDTTAAPRSETLWSLGINNSIIPNDFVLESLQFPYPNNRDKILILEVVGNLILSLRDGEASEKLFVDGKSLYFANSLQSPMENPIIKHRLGKITFEEENRVRTSLRVFTESGVTEGDIYLEKSDDAWLISDIQINLRRLQEVYTGRDEKFYPSSYGWITNTY